MCFKKITQNLLLLLSTLIICIFAIETYLKLTDPYSAHGAATEMTWMSRQGKAYTVDPEFGFRPILGNNKYSEYGTKTNHYPIKKRRNVKRILFIGDSVTQRGKIIRALKGVYGESEFEFWNAGVESFNTAQEVKYFRKYNALVHPDHVILTFHLNDFQTTPVAFSEDDKFVVYAPHRPQMNINPRLFEHSHIYRWWLGAFMDDKDNNFEAMATEIHQNMRELKTILKEKKIALTVLVFPFLKAHDQWGEYVRSRNKIINILRELDIRYFDLLETLTEAIDEGIEIRERPEDFLHPSQEISDLFADYLFENGIFQTIDLDDAVISANH